MTTRLAHINFLKQFFNLHTVGTVKIKRKWRIDVPIMFMNGQNTRMIFEVLSIVTVIYPCNTVSDLNKVIIKKLCNGILLSNDNIYCDEFYTVRNLCPCDLW